MIPLTMTPEREAEIRKHYANTIAGSIKAATGAWELLAELDATRAALEESQFQVTEADFGYGGWNSIRGRLERELTQSHALNKELAEALKALKDSPSQIPRVRQMLTKEQVRSHLHCVPIWNYRGAGEAVQELAEDWLAQQDEILNLSQQIDQQIVELAQAVNTIRNLRALCKELAEALEKISDWPDCYPCNANIFRMREFAKAVLAKFHQQEGK